MHFQQGIDSIEGKAGMHASGRCMCKLGVGEKLPKTKQASFLEE